jgi:S-adenosylmethionine decarboxylase
MPKDFKGWPHLMLSGFGCKKDGKKHLGDLDFIYDFLYQLPEKIGMKRLGTPNVEKIDKTYHADPGISGTVIIYTSHISIHTFTNGQKDGLKKPRKVDRRIFTPFFTADVYSCKDFDVEETIKQFVKSFRPDIFEQQLVYRLREDSETVSVESVDQP